MGVCTEGGEVTQGGGGIVERRGGVAEERQHIHAYTYT